MVALGVGSGDSDGGGVGVGVGVGLRSSKPETVEVGSGSSVTPTPPVITARTTNTATMINTRATARMPISGPRRRRWGVGEGELGGESAGLVVVPEDQVCPSQ